MISQLQSSSIRTQEEYRPWSREAGLFQCPEQGDTVPVLELLMQALYMGLLYVRCDLERVVIRGS